MSGYLLSVLLPVLDEEENLPILFDLLEEQLRKIGQKYEVIIIEDNSKDRTREICLQRQKESPEKYVQ